VERNRTRRDAHHTLHDRVSWSARPQAEYIRKNSSMIAHDIARTAHNLLHRMTEQVPVPGICTLQYVANRLPSGLDVISGIDTYSSLVEQSLKNPKTKPIERQIGMLSIEAIQAQKDYIIDGLPTNRRIIA